MPSPAGHDYSISLRLDNLHLSLCSWGCSEASSVTFSSPFTCLTQNPILSYNNPHLLPPRHQEALSEQILTLGCETMKENEAQFDNNKGTQTVTAGSPVTDAELYVGTMRQTKPQRQLQRVLLKILNSLTIEIRELIQ